MNLVSTDGATDRLSFDYPSCHMTRRAFHSLAVHRKSVWLMSSEHEPPDPRRRSVDAAAGLTAGTQARCSSLTLPAGGWVSPLRKEKKKKAVHYSPGRWDQVQIKSYSCVFARVSWLKTNAGAEQPSDITAKSKMAFVGFYFCTTSSEYREHGENSISMISSQEAGRYPAYKEMVAEYRWLNKCMYLKTSASSAHLWN